MAEQSKSKPDEPVEPTRSRRILDRLGRLVAGSSLPEIMLISTLCMARYIKNSDFSYPSEIVLNIVLFSVLVSVIFYVYRLLLRDRLGAHAAALLLSWFAYNFQSAFPRLRQLAEWLIPDTETAFTAAIMKLFIAGIVFGLIGLAVKRISKLKQLQTVPLLKFLIFVISFIFAVQVGKVGLRVWEIRDDLAYRVPASSQLTTASESGQKSEKPNVYYLLFDRYANNRTLNDVYEYDNSAMTDFLQQQGFSVRQDAYSNYPFTMQSVSSTLSADYHADLRKQFDTDGDFQTGFPYRAQLNDSPVTAAFQKNGYQYNQVSSWWDFTRQNPSADTNPAKSFRLRAFGKNFWLTDLQRDIVNRSALSPLLLQGFSINDRVVIRYQLDRNPQQNFMAEMDALKRIATSSASQTKPQFTFAHVLSPHDPYVFDANGNTPKYDPNRTDDGLDEYKKYTAQLTYVNKQLTNLISTIRSKDPDAVIVLQADEGPYPKAFRGELTDTSYFDPINLTQAERRQKFGILAAYYLPDGKSGGDTQPVTSSVNAFRVVLNEYLGYQLPLLDDCHYSAGDKFKLYNYRSVSQSLTGQPEADSCQKLR